MIILSMIRRIFLSAAAAVLIETAVFNAPAWRQAIRGNPHLELGTEQLTFQNWDGSKTEGFTSLLDPMIFVEGLGIMADTIEVRTDMEPLPLQYTLFYTTEEDEPFSGEKMMALEPVTGDDQYDLGLWVQALRIDPGEEAGTTLHEITFSLNAVRWDISIARIVAMLVIWWGTKGLMALQKPPDYGIQRQEADYEA